MQKRKDELKRPKPRKTVRVGNTRVPVESLKTTEGIIRAYLTGYKDAFRRLGD